MSKGLILIAGLPAAGKSTCARYLDEKLQIPYFCKDNLNEIIGACMTIPDQAERRKLSIASVLVLLHIADRVLSSNRPVIIESNFKPGELSDVRGLIEKHACRTMTLVFSGDLHIIFDRFMERENSGARAAIHKMHGVSDFDTFRKAVTPLADFDVGGLRLCIDATDLNQIDYEALALNVESFLAGS